MNASRRVSVVVPAYNTLPHVAETIESIRRQNYDDIELIVVDDYSTDGTWELIQGQASVTCAMRNASNLGAPASRNRGARSASGDFLMFIDSDDIIEQGTVGSLSESLTQSDADIALCSWKYLRHGEAVTIESSGRAIAPPENDYILGWLSDWWVPPCGVMWRRSSFEATGGWDETLAANQDGDIMLRALLAGAKVVQSNGGLGLYRKHSNHSISESRSLRVLDSRFRVCNKIEALIRTRGWLDKYGQSLGRIYYDIARAAYAIDHELGRKSEQCAYRLARDKAVTGTFIHRVTSKMIGLERKERLSAWVHSNRRPLR